MKQLLRKLIAGVEARFLNTRETELLKQIDPEILKEDDDGLLRFNSKFKPGVLKFKPDGAPIFIGLDESEPLNLHSEYIANARENDIIIVQRIMGRAKKSAAKVVAVVEHDLTYSVGIITATENGKKLLDLYTDINVNCDKDQGWINAQETDRLFLVDNRHNRIIKEIGDINDPTVDEAISMAKYNKEEAFPLAVTEEVAAIDLKVDINDYPERKDLRDLPFCTIDPVTAKDYDDAIYYDTDKQTLYVAIADVSSYVKAESPLDAEAYRRGFSIYFPHKSVPMLPRELSETLCSLQPHVDRLAFVFEMPVNAQMIEIEEAKVYEAVIHSARRFNYDEIDAYLEGENPQDDTDAQILTWLFPLQEMMDRFREKRMKKGYLFRSPEIEMRIDDKGMITHTEHAKETPSHALIEDCMLLANIEAAHCFATGLFRVHESPSLAKLDNLYSQLAMMGLRFKLSANLKETITNIQRAADEMDRRIEVDTLLIQTQMQAHYSPDNLGHFGLGFDAYAHFTSPIRRYSDLIVHRLIKAIQAKDKDEISKTLQPIQATAIDVSTKERESADVAVDFAKRKYARWAREHVGKSVTATVTYLSEDMPKAVTEAPIVGANLILDPLPESITLFDKVIVSIKEANIKNCKIYATFEELAADQTGEA